MYDPPANCGLSYYPMGKPWHLFFGGFAGAVAAIAIFLINSSREPNIVYDRTDVSVPTAAGAQNPLASTFLQIQFANVGKRPAHGLLLTISTSQVIAHHDWEPRLSGEDEMRCSVSGDQKRLDCNTVRFPSAVRVLLRVWLRGRVCSRSQDSLRRSSVRLKKWRLLKWL